MKSVRGAFLLLVSLLFAMLCGDVELLRASEENCIGLAEKVRFGISASYEVHGDTTNVRIKWWGCSEEDMVVVDLDSRRARDYRQLDIDPGSTQLFGLVLVRSAGVTDSATFSYKRSEFVVSFGGGAQVLSVFLTTGIDLGYVSGDLTIKGGGHLTEVAELTSADCTDDFQTLCRDDSGAYAEIFISNVSESPRQAMVESRCRPFVQHSTVGGSLLLNIAH